MSKRKRNASIDAAVSVAVLLGVLWAFDRPLARTLFQRVGWGIAIFVVLAGVFFVIFLIVRRARSRKTSLVVQGPLGENRSDSSGLPGALRKILDRDPRLDSRASHASAISLPAEKPHVWSLDLIRDLEWKRFEMLCAGFFEIQEYHPKTTRIGADGGIDIILHRKGDPEGKVFGVVQCKAWSRIPVGVKPVRELFGVKAAEEVPLAVFMTTGDYTKDAKAFADGKHLQLITGTKLLGLLRKLPESTSSELLRKVTAGDYKTPTCPHCDLKMVLRRARKGGNSGSQFWGCRNYPRCHQILNLSSKVG
ncbi:MAG: restriction endonuclease [Terriglobia bacterium]